MAPGRASGPADAIPLIDSAVLVPVYRGDDGDLRIVLIRRSEGGAHGGHLAFPGGKCDPGDATRLDTALREAWEEIGLAPGDVEVLAELPAAQTLTSGFRVFAFLGRVTRRVAWRPDPREVSEVVDLAVADLARADAHAEELMHYPAWPEPRRTPFYRVGGCRVWGVTYRILQPLLPRLLAGEWNL